MNSNESSILKRNRHVAIEAPDGSCMRNPYPHINPKIMKSNSDLAHVMEEAREGKYSSNCCEYCSSKRYQIFHQHFSTSQQRAFAKEWTKGDHICPVCHQMEAPILDKNASRRVILCDSTLYGVWDRKELPNISGQLEIECIVGGKVRDLARALRKNLISCPNRLEIVVIAGIENIAGGDEALTVIEELKDIKRLVGEHSKVARHKTPGYASICTLRLPPKLCSLRVPDVPELAEWKPSPGFVNRYPVIKNVNEAIKKMNLDDDLNFLNIHLQGIKMLKSGPQHKFDSRPGSTRIWREAAVFEKLHFTMENKLKIMQYLQNTFASNEKKVVEVD